MVINNIIAYFKRKRKFYSAANIDELLCLDSACEEVFSPISEELSSAELLLIDGRRNHRRNLTDNRRSFLRRAAGSFLLIGWQEDIKNAADSVNKMIANIFFMRPHSLLRYQ